MDYQKEREKMVRRQLQGRDINDPRVLEAFRQVPRHLFIPDEYRDMAYHDSPLPIGTGQTISQPYIVALMTQLLELKGDEKVMEVGTGSGYQAAILGLLAKEVHTIERHKNLAKKAGELLKQLGFDNIHIQVGDGTLGLPDLAPFDGVIVTAAAPDTPQTLLDQLVDGGKLVIPVGNRGGQYLLRWTRKGNDFHKELIAPVAFVPLIGEYGWNE